MKRNGEPMKGEIMIRRVFDHAVLGHEFTAQLGDYTTGGICAREESLNNVWRKRGMIYIQTVEPVGGFWERDRYAQLHKMTLLEHIDPVMVAVEFRGRIEIRVVTRNDGRTYYGEHGEYPPFTNKEIAEMEHKMHHRWPLYTKRLAV